MDMKKSIYLIFGVIIIILFILLLFQSNEAKKDKEKWLSCLSETEEKYSDKAKICETICKEKGLLSA